MSVQTNQPVDAKDPWDLVDEDWQEMIHKVKSENVSEDMILQMQDKILSDFQNLLNQEKTELRGGKAKVSEIERRRQLIDIAHNLGISKSLHDVLVDGLLDDMFRKGPLQPLWERKDITDIQIFVPFDDEQRQLITYADYTGRQVYDRLGFRNYRHAMSWLKRNLAQMDDTFDPADVVKDCTFPAGERVNIISGGAAGISYYYPDGSYDFIPGMVISVRLFTKSYTLTDLANVSLRLDAPPVFDASELKVVRRNYTRKPSYYKYTGGMFDPATMDYLRIMNILGKNHILAGGTGTGKTTNANAMTGVIPEGTLLIVIEESIEMQPQCSGHVIRLQQIEGKFTLEDAMKVALRMFPDRIFIAEVRDKLAYVFWRSMQSGHDGQSTTLHASSCADAIEVYVNFCANHESRPDRDTVRDGLYRNLHTIIHTTRFESEEKITRWFDEIVQVLPDGTLHPIMTFTQEGVDKLGNAVGYFTFFGPTDEFVEEMFRAGIPIPDSWGWN